MKVEFVGDNLELRNEIEPVLEEYAELLNADLIVSNPHSQPSSPETVEGKLFIKFWSTPDKTPAETSKTEIKSAFGINLAVGQKDAVKPTGSGLPLIDPITERVVGEVHGGTMYVLFDLPHKEATKGGARELMSGIMQCYIALQNPAKRKELEGKAAAVKAREALLTKDARSQYACDHWTNFADAMRKWLSRQEIINLPAVLSFCVPEGKKAAMPRDGKLHLVFETDDLDLPGAQVIRKGDMVARYIPGGLYIQISNIMGCPKSYIYPLVEEILQQLLPLVIEKDPERAAAILQQISENERKRHREEWIKACSQRFEKTVNETRQKISAAEKACEAAQAELVAQIRISDGQKRKLEQLEAARPQILERYAAELDKLLKLPHITAVEIANNVISVFTDRMYAEYDGATYDIGDFRIDIYTDGSNGGVLMFNLTRRINGYEEKMHAPHVFPNGKPCLGNLKEAIPQYIGAYEYSVVAMLAIQYLQSVNADDGAGRYINEWPKIQRKEESR